MEEFGISARGPHASVITFEQDAKINIRLDQFSDIGAFTQEVVKNIPHTPKGTAVDKALNLANGIVFRKEYGGRLNAKNFVVFITDGIKNERYQRMIDISNEIRDREISLLIINIGANINTGVLRQMAGNDFGYALVDNAYELNSRKFVSNMYMTIGQIGK